MKINKSKKEIAMVVILWVLLMGVSGLLLKLEYNSYKNEQNPSNYDAWSGVVIGYEDYPAMYFGNDDENPCGCIYEVRLSNGTDVLAIGLASNSYTSNWTPKHKTGENVIIFEYSGSIFRSHLFSIIHSYHIPAGYKYVIVEDCYNYPVDIQNMVKE